MGQRYWVIGGEYRDCRFTRSDPGTEAIPGPFPDELQGADGMAAADLPGPPGATERYSICVEPVLQ